MRSGKSGLMKSGINDGRAKLFEMCLGHSEDQASKKLCKFILSFTNHPVVPLYFLHKKVFSLHILRKNQNWERRG